MNTMKSNKLFRTSLTLPRDLDSFLNELGLELRQNNGHKLGKTQLIRALITATRKLYENGKIDINDIRSEEDFEKRLLEAFKRYK